MIKVLVINGSPGMEKEYTALLLDPFIQGMKGAGAEVELFYAHKMEIGHCTGEMYCWYEKPEHVTFRMICRYYIPSCGNVTS